MSTADNKPALLMSVATRLTLVEQQRDELLEAAERVRVCEVGTVENDARLMEFWQVHLKIMNNLA